MSFFEGVTPKSINDAEDGFRQFRIGDNYARISKVEEKTSKSGNPMIEITFVNEEGASIRYYIVEGEWKLSKLKQLYYAFGIQPGEKNIQNWINKWANVVTKEGIPYNGNPKVEVSYVTRAGDQKPKTTQPVSTQQEVSEGDDFTDDIPF